MLEIKKNKEVMRVEQEKKAGNVESVTLEQVPMEERKAGQTLHDPGRNHDLCAKSDAGRNPGRIHADVTGHLVRSDRVCSDRGADDILRNYGKRSRSTDMCCCIRCFWKTGLIKTDLCIVHDLHDWLVCSTEWCVRIRVFQSDRNWYGGKDSDSGINSCVGVIMLSHSSI